MWKLKCILTITKSKQQSLLKGKSLLTQVDAAFEQIKINKALTDGYLSDPIIESL